MKKEFSPERLREVREGLGINMAEAARVMELSAMGYYRYETGLRTPSPQMIEVLAQKFGTSPDYLKGRNTDSRSHQFIVNDSNSPELYELIELSEKMDAAALRRLTAYAKALQKGEK